MDQSLYSRCLRVPLQKGSKWYQMVQVSQFGDGIVIGEKKEEESHIPSEYSSKALLREERRRLCHRHPPDLVQQVTQLLHVRRPQSVILFLLLWLLLLLLLFVFLIFVFALVLPPLVLTIKWQIPKQRTR